MLLKICEDNMWFSSETHMYIDLLCYIVIFLCLIFALYVYKMKNISMNKNIVSNDIIIIILSSAIFFMFLIFIFIYTVDGNNIKGCSCEYKKFSKLSNQNNSIGKFDLNRVIIIGDSRMELIEIEKNEIETPKYMTFIAKSGAKVDWFKKIALPELDKQLKDKTNDYHYHVVFNMGVNDLDQGNDALFTVRDYYNLYKNIVMKYSNVNFYFLSVNPIDEKIIHRYWPRNLRTNTNIEIFNNKILSYMKEDGFENFKYCDSYDNINFITYDGLHYRKKTDKVIINYINDNCIDYKKSV